MRRRRRGAGERESCFAHTGRQRESHFTGIEKESRSTHRERERERRKSSQRFHVFQVIASRLTGVRASQLYRGGSESLYRESLYFSGDCRGRGGGVPLRRGRLHVRWGWGLRFLDLMLGASSTIHIDVSLTIHLGVSLTIHLGISFTTGLGVAHLLLPCGADM